MQVWHFNITGKVLLEDDDQILNIYQENIQSLIRVSNYKDEVMPQMIMNVRLDKNFIDLITMNAKTATVHLKIEKFLYTEEMSEEQRTYITYLEDDFNIFVDNDINHNKDTDYQDTGDGERKDIFDDLYIGLISKTSIEANKMKANAVFMESSIMDIAAYFLQETHILIEPFTYNPSTEQLIVPPQEFISQTLEFLNEVSVFYDTRYLFFIDEPTCTYLISRSGLGIQKKDDKFVDVFFDILAKMDPSAGVPGMYEDNEKQRYTIPVDAVDTEYNIDHNTAKVYNKIEDIVDPNIENTRSALDEVADAISGIKDVIGKVKSAAESLQKAFKDTFSKEAWESIPNTLHQFKRNVSSNVENFLDGELKEKFKYGASDVTNVLNSLPTANICKVGATYEPILKNKSSYTQTIVNTTQSFNSNLAKSKEFSANFTKASDLATSCAYDTTKMDNYVSGVSPTSAQTGCQNTNKAIIQLGNSSKELNNSIQPVVEGRVYPARVAADYRTLTEKVRSIISELKSRRALIDPQYASYKPSVDQAVNTLEKEILPSLEEDDDDLDIALTAITEGTQKFLQVPDLVNKVIGDFNNLTGSLANIANTNIGNKIKKISLDLQNIGKASETALEKIKNIGKKGAQPTFNVSDLTRIASDLGSIADLTGMGKLGRSFFETSLKIGQSKTVRDSSKIIKTINDNVNKIKNIKSTIEDNVNKVTINKYDLDPSVFTPNKKYTIKNYDTHEDKDGIFVLNKKTEIYVQQGNNFLCNTLLEFSKKANIGGSDSSSGGNGIVIPDEAMIVLH